MSSLNQSDQMTASIFWQIPAPPLLKGYWRQTHDGGGPSTTLLTKPPLRFRKTVFRWSSDIQIIISILTS